MATSWRKKERDRKFFRKSAKFSTIIQPLQLRARKIIFNAAQNLVAVTEEDPADHSPSNTNIYSCHCRDCYLNWFLKNVFPQVLVVLSIQVKRSCSRYITSMATLRLRWTSSQVNTVTLFTRVPGTDQPLVREASTCTYRATLQATVVPTPTVATVTLSPLVTLHLVTPVDFMQEVDPVSTSLPLMLKCFTRQQLKPCNLKVDHVCQPKQYKYI